MKIILISLIIILGVAIGLILGLGLFQGFELVLSMFILFPLVFILGTILLGRTKKEVPKEKDHQQDRFSRWE
ncbi:MAG TPA: hypothetical protein PK087_02325 [Bacilli bacterium]|nr:MAG: hypothetical protein BWY97_01314 [Tenericutes bacterium ADurb.BinA124]HNZ50043.1 hypothetical protein [Bacilli bacterium]HOH18140.1 hypothetical protein [Bacilli bacterium]HPN61034.1 hypothetical protein [Bacilli bacterium]HPX84177.1 hypothetical protein [Bacilli bacterium]